MTRAAPTLVLCAGLALCGSLSVAAPSDPEGLARCAQIAGAEQRLACFDALSNHSAPSSPAAAAPSRAPAAPVAAPAAAPPVQAPAPVPAPPARTATAPAVAPVAASPGGAAGNSDADFGLNNSQMHAAAPQGPQSIQAHVDHVYVQQLSRSYVVLDNGQTWACTDGGMNLYNGELVTIRRAALGSFMLVPTRSKGSYHVRRVQ